jgi:ABC-type Na+ transport system ATPase subunit NatA
VLRVADAAFERDGVQLVPPFSVELATGERAMLGFADARAAKIAARMTAGIVKPTSGTVLIGDFDPRVQPVQAKRLTGFVPALGDPAMPRCRDGGLGVHAALFEVPLEAARTRVRHVLDALEADDELAFAVALALMRPVELLVFDRPPPDRIERFYSVVDARIAVACTRVFAATPAREFVAR